MQPWSISALAAFETCPKQFYVLRVDKSIKEPESEQMLWGKRVHKAFEEYFGSGKEFPAGMGGLQEIAEDVGRVIEMTVGEDASRHVELKLGLNEALEPVGYFDENIWLRLVGDLVVVSEKVALVLDWKTGKPSDNDDQLALAAATTMHHFPDVDTVLAGFVWLKAPKGRRMSVHTYYRDQLQAIWGRFTGRVAEYQRAFREADFQPRPNGLCRRHCPVVSCPHHGL
jgi:hypothetical protein